MKIYPSRKATKYVNHLSELFKLENLEKTALEVSSKRTIKGKSYKKFIRIDFIGTAGTTLLDAGRMFHEKNLFGQFCELLKNSRELAERGVFIKVRFLFQYPYSVSSYSRIQAETSNFRASIDEPSYKRHFNLLEQVDEDAFNESFFVNLQKATLIHLQTLEEELRKEYNWNTKENPSTITLRFSVVNPMLCGLFINETLFYDPYLSAKQRKEDHKLAHLAPVVEIKKEVKNDYCAFSAFEDHFRYYWELDTTLDCEDATYYQIQKPKSLRKFRQPQKVTFDAKAKRICYIEGISNDSEKISTWKRRVKRQFLKFCSDLSPSTSHENVFITCSWKSDPDGVPNPNGYARTLSNFLTNDFSENLNPIFNVHIMQATPSEFLSRQLFLALDNSTIGIILMTKDIKGEDGKYYCKPNIYHELGYLMKHLGKERILILIENGVEPPSNIVDLIRFEFDIERLSFRYHDLIRQINSMLDIPRIQVTNALDNHIERLEDFLKKGEINSNEYKSVTTKINQLKATFK